MGLSSLNAALAGLKISQQQINVISTNVSNVGTPGYNRRILPQTAQTINGETVGVLPGTILRNVDMNLTRDLWTQVTSVDNLSIKADYMNKVSQFHGAPEKELSVAAEISRLKDSFATLADNPGDSFRLSSVINQAQDTSNKINELANYLSTLRNDVQSEMQSTVTRINDLLGQIADLNGQIKNAMNIGNSSAALEDQRDTAIQELSGLIGISFFTRGDGVLVVQTTQGVEIASDRARLLSFDPHPLSATTYYPDSAAGIYVGDPVTEPYAAIDITDDAPGGRLGGLLEMRDEIFPKQMAQLDEMAHKLALRFETQGLRLFTDATGVVPLDTPPDPSTNPPTSVTYVGFAATIRVNQEIINDHSLLQKGTYGGTLPAGSNEVIRRVIQFAFGNVNYQLASNTNTATGVDLLNDGGVFTQDLLGIPSSNTVLGTRNLSAYNDIADLVAAANGTLDPPTDVFRMTFQTTSLGLGPVNIDVSLSAVTDTGGNAVADLIAYINGTVIPALPLADQSDLTDMDVNFSIGPSGELQIDSRGDITLDATVVANGMGEDGLALLGFSEGLNTAQQPYFDIRVGNNEFTRIYIEPYYTWGNIVSDLNAVDGIVAQLDANGFLQIRPGNSFTNPDFGGDIEIVGGPFETAGATLSAPPALAGRTSMPDGVNIVSALFGTFTSSGGIIQNLSPVHDVEYQSETYNGSGVYVSFREAYLGPGTTTETEVIGSTRVDDFSRKMINQQAQELLLVESRKTDSDALRAILQKQLQDDSGVNLDEELGNLIVVQTAYAAAARVITAVDDLFQELLNAVR